MSANALCNQEIYTRLQIKRTKQETEVVSFTFLVSNITFDDMKNEKKFPADFCL